MFTTATHPGRPLPQPRPVPSADGQSSEGKNTDRSSHGQPARQRDSFLLVLLRVLGAFHA